VHIVSELIFPDWAGLIELAEGGWQYFSRHFLITFLYLCGCSAGWESKPMDLTKQMIRSTFPIQTSAHFSPDGFSEIPQAASAIGFAKAKAGGA